jgi:hypothetical protein
MHQRDCTDWASLLGRFVQYADAVRIDFGNVDAPAIVAGETFLICF